MGSSTSKVMFTEEQVQERVTAAHAKVLALLAKQSEAQLEATQEIAEWRQVAQTQYFWVAFSASGMTWALTCLYYRARCRALSQMAVKEAAAQGSVITLMQEQLKRSEAEVATLAAAGEAQTKTFVSELSQLRTKAPVWASSFESELGSLRRTIGSANTNNIRVAGAALGVAWATIMFSNWRLSRRIKKLAATNAPVIDNKVME